MKYTMLKFALLAACTALLMSAGRAAAQHGETGPQRGPRVAAYPVTRDTDPAAVKRGRELYMDTIGCGKCHAADLRGTEQGVSLLHSVAMMEDANGELIKTATGMMPTHGGRYKDITDAQYSDMAQYMKSIPNIGTGGVPIIIPAVFHAGDPVAGQKYFAANCASCHAVTKGASSTAENLAGIGAGVTTTGDAARSLQQRWISPSALGRPNLHIVTTGTVTMPNGEKIEGRVTRLTEFLIVITPEGGTARTIERKSETDPKIQMHYPLAGHAALMRTIKDKDIHDVTGYLVTLK